MVCSLLSSPIPYLEKNKRPILGLVITLYVLAGVIYSLYLGSNFRYLPDEVDYFTLASNLAFKGQYSLDGSQLTAYRPPGYPLFLAPFRLLGMNIIGLRMVNFFVLGFCIFILYKILQEQFSSLAGLIAALLVALYPVVFYTAGTLYPQTLASLLLILSIYLFTSEPAQNWKILLAGLLAGWLILTVPTFIFLLLVLALWSWIYQKERITARISLLLVPAILVVGAWSLRNFAVFNTFVFVSTNSGENLLLGNSENTTPNGGRTIDFSSYERQAAGLNEVQRDQYFRDQAISYIKAHKLTSLKMYFLKLVNFFNYRNELVTNSEASTASDILLLVTFGLLLLLALIRLALSKSLPLTPFEILLTAIYVVGALVSAVFFTRIRFRVPLDFMLIMLVGVFIGGILMRREENMGW